MTKPLRLVFLGRKAVAAKALRQAAESGHAVLAVIPSDDPPGELADEARRLNIPALSDEQLYGALKEWKDVDLVVSVVHRRRLLPPLIALPGIACVNFHPAPLPEYRGFSGYNFGIYEQRKSWAVTAHHVDETFDTGDIVQQREFDIDFQRETAWSLETKSHGHLLELFRDVLDLAARRRSLPRRPQGPGRTITRKDFEKLRKISPEDTPEQIERKVRAFWRPPFGGAAIELGGREFTVVSQAILDDLARGRPS